MLAVLANTWPLLAGMFLLMIGNGMQGTVLGVRGGIESFDSLTMGFVMAGYFLGFLVGARITPVLLRQVGHVRVFAAFASLISAAMVIYASVVDPVAWILMRVLVGICMSGVYIVAESWLNDGSENTNRGQTLSAYLTVQMLGIVLAQAMINVADPAGYDLFIIMAVAVSVAVVPILLSAAPVPVFETTRRMSFLDLYNTSPLGVVGCFFLGGVYACIFGMASVWGSATGLTNAEISLFIGAIYLGGMVFQFPIGWLSDRIDRRLLITACCAVGAAGAALALVAGSSFVLLVVAAVMIGGTANPLYALLIAYTNDYLEHDQMASAAAGLILMNGIGAAGTPILVGALMDLTGPPAFPAFILFLMGSVTLYALYRMSVRPSVPVDETMPVAPVGMIGSTVAGVAAQDAVIEQVLEAEEDEEFGDRATDTDGDQAPVPAFAFGPPRPELKDRVSQP